jgi:hypothetical protein
VARVVRSRGLPGKPFPQNFDLPLQIGPPLISPKTLAIHPGPPQVGPFPPRSYRIPKIPYRLLRSELTPASVWKTGSRSRLSRQTDLT